MPLRRTGAKRVSEQNVALVQMQIAAQARNQRWHDFLCAKRDELQARLRQQGYAQHTLHTLEEADSPADSEQGPEGGSPGVLGVVERADRAPRWGASAPTDLSTLAHDEPSTDAPDLQAAEVADWWSDENRATL